MNRANVVSKVAFLLAAAVVASCAGEKERVRSVKEASAEAQSMEKGAPAAAATAAAPVAAAASSTAQAAPAAVDKAKADAEAAAAKAKADAQAAADKAKADADAAAAKLKAEAAAAAAAVKPQLPKVLALPANQKTAVNLELRFRTGSVDDPQGKAGLTLLAARVMSEGGTVALDSKQLLEALFPIAAQTNTRVDREQTSFTARVHKDVLDKLLPIFTDQVLHPRWDEKEFARIKDAMVSDLEKRLRQADDENLGKEALAGLMYRGHAYARPIAGLVSDLKSATLADAKAHAAKVFTVDRLTIGLSGNYPEGLGEKLSQTLSALPQVGAPAVAVTKQKPPVHPRYLLVEKAGAASAVSMGFPVDFGHKDADWAALSVARSAFGEHRQFNGRLMQRIRELRGLNYGDYAYIEHYQQQGGDASSAQTGRARTQQDFTIWLRPVKNENRLFAVRAALRELARSVGEEPFTQAEVAKTKGFLDGYILLFDQTDNRKLGYALDGAFLGETDFLKTWRKNLDGVTVDQVNAAWKKHIDPSKLQIVIVGENMKAVRDQLLSNAPSPITYASPKGKDVTDADADIIKFPYGAASADDVEIVPVEKLFE
ncbi:MAG: insulinase family protein [Deltaproteobacteria bacterium]|nr:insulinase family protein [Deltaproteobacteria bacterium]